MLDLPYCLARVDLMSRLSSESTIAPSNRNPPWLLSNTPQQQPIVLSEHATELRTPSLSVESVRISIVMRTRSYRSTEKLKSSPFTAPSPCADSSLVIFQSTRAPVDLLPLSSSQCSFR